MDKNLFRVLVVDDDPDARFLLNSLLKELNKVEVVGLASNSEEALYMLVEHYPDLVLLNVNMPGKSEIDFITLVNKRNIDVPVVIVSAYTKYAIDAIRNNVYNYLLKPICRDELKKLISKFRRANHTYLPGKLMKVLDTIKEEAKIRINSRHSYILINPAEIVYCTSEDGYSLLFLTNGKTEISNSSLAQLEEKLTTFNFYRLGRSTLINSDFIREIDKGSNRCILKHEKAIWTVQVSHKSIKELLSNNFNYD